MPAIRTIEPRTLRDWMAAGEVVLINVRELHEYARARIPGAVPIPLSQLDGDGLPEAEGRRVVVCCASGARSMMAADRLLADRYGTVFNLDGGLAGWNRAGYDIESDSPRNPRS